MPAVMAFSSVPARKSGSSKPTSRFDRAKSLIRSATGAPISSQITYNGSGAAMSRTNSAVPRAATSSIRPSQISLMCFSSRPITRGVNPRFTKPRCRVCRGGSMLIIARRWNSMAASELSPNVARRRLDEKASGFLDTYSISGRRVTAQKPGHPGAPPSACQNTGACSRSQRNASCGGPPRWYMSGSTRLISGLIASRLSAQADMNDDTAIPARAARWSVAAWSVAAWSVAAWSVAAAQRRVGQRRRLVPAVRRVEVGARRHDLIDLIQDVGGQDGVGRTKLALQMLHRPRSDDGRGDGRVAEHEGQRQVDQGQASLAGQAGQFLGRFQLGLVTGQAHVIALR